MHTCVCRVAFLHVKTMGASSFDLNVIQRLDQRNVLGGDECAACMGCQRCRLPEQLVQVVFGRGLDGFNRRRLKTQAMLELGHDLPRDAGKGGRRGEIPLGFLHPAERHEVLDFDTDVLLVVPVHGSCRHSGSRHFSVEQAAAAVFIYSIRLKPCCLLWGRLMNKFC